MGIFVSLDRTLTVADWRSSTRDSGVPCVTTIGILTMTWWYVANLDTTQLEQDPQLRITKAGQDRCIPMGSHAGEVNVDWTYVRAAMEEKTAQSIITRLGFHVSVCIRLTTVIFYD